MEGEGVGCYAQALMSQREEMPNVENAKLSYTTQGESKSVGSYTHGRVGVGCYSKALFLPLPTRNTVFCDAAGTWLNISGF